MPAPLGPSVLWNYMNLFSVCGIINCSSNINYFFNIFAGNGRRTTLAIISDWNYSARILTFYLGTTDRSNYRIYKNACSCFGSFYCFFYCILCIFDINNNAVSHSGRFLCRRSDNLKYTVFIYLANCNSYYAGSYIQSNYNSIVCHL